MLVVFWSIAESCLSSVCNGYHLRLPASFEFQETWIGSQNLLPFISWIDGRCSVWLENWLEKKHKNKKHNHDVTFCNVNDHTFFFKPFLVFTWRHSGHVGAPKQRNGSHLGVPDWSLGKKWQRTPNNSFNQVRNWLKDMTDQTNQKRFSESQVKDTDWSEQKRSLIVKLTGNDQFEN